MDNIIIFILIYLFIYLFLPKTKKLKILILPVRIYSQEIGMEFGIEKCAQLIMKSGKRHMTEGMELIILEKKIRTLSENETNKY